MTHRILLAGLLSALLLPRIGNAQEVYTYRLPHYEEDWTFLGSTPQDGDWLGPVKYLTFADEGNAYVSFGGEIRETYERFHNPNFGLQPQDPNGYLLQRYLLHADLHLSESARFYVEALSALENGRISGPRPIIDEDKFDFHQGFVDFSFSSTRRHKAFIRVGRQELAVGSGRLVALREGTNVPFSFDGIRVGFHQGGWDVDVFATKPVRNRTGILDDPPQPGAWFWGVYSTRPVHAGGRALHFDGYYLGLNRNPAAFNQGTAQETRHTMGARIWNSTGAWNYDAEGMFQFGSFGTGEIRAWRMAGDTFYGFVSQPWHPRLGFAADVTSGDRDLSNPNLETFNALFQSGTYSGRAQILGPANTIRIEPSITLAPHSGASISAGWGFYWRESIHDGLYSIAGNLLVPGNTTTDRYEGSRPIIQADWQASRHLSLHVNYIYVFNGPFGQQAIRGTSGMSYVSPWVTYEF